MNDYYIKTVLDDKNEFIVNASFTLLGMQFNNIDIKIDTGCPYSIFPLQRLNISEASSLSYKNTDVTQLLSNIMSSMLQGEDLAKAIRKEKGVTFEVFRGAETGGEKHAPIDFLSANSILNTKSIAFKHKINNISLGNTQIDELDVYISYDRKNNILLGMDILKLMDIHIGEANDGKITMLACFRDKLNEAYLQELESTFNMLSNIQSNIVRHKIK